MNWLRWHWIWLVTLSLGMGFRVRGGDRPDAVPYLGFPQTAPRAGNWRMEPAFPGQEALPSPVGFIPYPGNRLLVYCQPGQIYLIPNDPGATTRVLMLDLSPRTLGHGDTGLLNVVLHPEFGREDSPNRRYLYAWYAYHEGDWPTGWEQTTWNRLSRFTVSEDGETVDPSSEWVLIEQADRHLWHAGGGLMFHPDDGFLYVAVSDEGGENDSYDSTQQITDGFFSGILRIDVDRRGGDVSHPIRHQPIWGRTEGYYIPNDNPWTGRDGVLEEFYAVGLRNPYRMSHDPVSGMVFIGDVGQNEGEEVNVLRKGANYGWPFRNVIHDGPKDRPPEILGTLADPFFHYPRSWGFCVIGGFVYRGGRYADLLDGKYVFSDLGGAVWAATFNGNGVTDIVQIAWTPEPWEVVSLGRDPEGEIFLTANRAGALWRLQFDPSTGSGLPSTLSATGLFSDLETLEPAAALVPYEVNSPLWSDGALKRRWFAVPHDSNAPDPESRIGFTESGAWDFPDGSVFVKHFDLATDEAAPEVRRRLETRVLVRSADGGAYGMTYRWREDQSDADLVLSRQTEDIEITTSDGVRRQSWLYPGPFDCLICHTPQAGFVLGVKTRQLNRTGAAAQARNAGNQLARLIEAGFFKNGPADPEAVSALPALPDPAGGEATLHDRVRSYLDANCAHCHRPAGVRAGFDARFATPLSEQGLIGAPVNDDLGRAGTRVVAPGNPDLSALYQRILRNDHVRMPPIARSEVDPAAIGLISEWIRSMPRASLVLPAAGPGIPADPLRLEIGMAPGQVGVERVEFRIDGTTIANRVAPPYRVVVGEIPWGWHELLAVVHGTDGIAYPSLPQKRWLHPSALVLRWQRGASALRSLEVFGPPGRDVVIETATTLGDWVPVEAGVLDPTLPVLLPDDAPHGTRLFRARSGDPAGR